MTRGVVYFAVGERYIAEAIRSVKSVKRSMPGLPCALFASESERRQVPSDLFEMQFDLDPSLGVKAQKISVLKRTPFDQTLYLDTDTYMVAPVHELFNLFPQFDLALAMASLGRLGDGVGEAPGSFPVMNTGVMVFRRCATVSALFDRWLELHANKARLDQPSFREALFNSSVRFAPLTNAYNFLLDFPQTARYQVKILHGRHPNIETLGPRVQPIAEVSCVLPVHYFDKTVLLGRKTPHPRLTELLRGILKMARRGR